MLQFENAEFFDYPFKHVVLTDCILGDRQEIWQEIKDLAAKNEDKHVENDNFSKLELKEAAGQIGEILKGMCSGELTNVCKRFFPEFEDLSADPTFDGGGLTKTPVGKFLRYHADFPYSNSARKYRVVNALLYLNEPEMRGGHLHLLDPESGTVEAQVKPEFGKILIFATSKLTPHGFSRIFEKPRYSVNSYFYADQPADGRVEPGKTEWIGQPPLR